MRTGRPRASTSRRSSTRPRCPRASRAAASQAQDHGLEPALDHALIAKAAPALESQDAGHRQLRHPQRAPHRRRHAGRRNRAPLRLGRIARRHHPLQIPRLGRPELRRIRSQRRHARTRRRLQRLSRQGPLRRPHHRLSAQDLQLPARRKHPRRQRRSLRRNQRRSLPQRHRRRALRRPQLRRNRGGRRRRRPRLRIHDQRHSSSSSARPAATSPPA